MDYSVLYALLELELDRLDQKEKDFKESYGSNWHPLIPLNNKALSYAFKVAEDIQNIISFGPKADFSNLTETLKPYLQVHYLPHSRAKIENYDNYFDSYLYSDNDKLNSTVITINIALPKDEWNFEIAYELAYLFVFYGFGDEEHIYDTKYFHNRIAHELRKNERDYLLLNRNLHKPNTNEKINVRDLICLNVACLTIIPEIQLYKLLATEPDDIITAICHKFKVSRRIANFRMKLEQIKHQ